MSKLKLVTTPVFRVSFPSVFEKTAMDDGKPAFELTMLFKENANLKAMKELLASACKDKWGKKIPSDLRKPFSDQGEKEYDGYTEGAMCAKAKSYNRKPQVINKSGNELDEEDFYAGCYARATVTAYAYGGKGTKFKPGVAFGLSNIIKIEDGERFDGGTDASDDFDDLIDDNEPDTDQNDGTIEDDEKEDSIF